MPSGQTLAVFRLAFFKQLTTHRQRAPPPWVAPREGGLGAGMGQSGDLRKLDAYVGKSQEHV